MSNPDKRIKVLRESLFLHFLAKKNGVRISDVAGFLANDTGDTTPWKTLGFETVEKFLYSQKDMIEIRRKVGDKNNYIFLKESYITPKYRSVRKTVLDQEVDKNAPIYENTSEISIEILMRPVKSSRVVSPCRRPISRQSDESSQTFLRKNDFDILVEPTPETQKFTYRFEPNLPKTVQKKRTANPVCAERTEQTRDSIVENPTIESVPQEMNDQGDLQSDDLEETSDPEDKNPSYEHLWIVPKRMTLLDPTHLTYPGISEEVVNNFCIVDHAFYHTNYVKDKEGFSLCEYMRTSLTFEILYQLIFVAILFIGIKYSDEE